MSSFRASSPYYFSSVSASHLEAAFVYRTLCNSQYLGARISWYLASKLTFGGNCYVVEGEIGTLVVYAATVMASGPLLSSSLTAPST